ncbi:tRNA(Ile)-lysidine synthetase [Skermanella stibiiresistens SB22]|uniref:tRNA(Ile)-lysidine synthase n=1 Tax=Skermanella stibiiresistens SB22 TaxID=1385369 RepID=W9H5A5_9PROT|nr:tRNA(Ile)-lysidine synthetase [Skermanella stibiiresistens SB22]
MGPFEPRPRVAVAVSGGPDSLALSLLLKGWVDRREGELLALTVDHGLRHNAADEAVQTGRWLAARGIAHDILRWCDDKPSSRIQQEAREARYRLLSQRCRADGILHLALAHHREDQAETVLLRFAKGSGPDGLAGMTPLREAPDVRILRPLLGVSRDSLKEVLDAAGQSWIEDPSNQSAAYARVRVRSMAATLAAEGWDASHAADTAKRAGRAREALELASAALLARAVEVWPEGCALVRPDLVGAAPDELAARVLGRCLAAVGGGGYQPRLDALERLRASLRVGSAVQGTTLGGCVVTRYRDGRLLIAREPAAIIDRIAIEAGATILWDGRFTIRTSTEGAGVVARLGAGFGKADSHLAKLPAVVREGLPVLWREDGSRDLPRFGFPREFNTQEEVRGRGGLTAVFAPPEPVSASAFVVV